MTKFKNSDYYHKRQYKIIRIHPDTYVTVPLSHTSYHGKKYARWLEPVRMPDGTEARALARIAIPKARMADVRAGKITKSKASVIVEILVPKRSAHLKSKA